MKLQSVWDRLKLPLVVVSLLLSLGAWALASPPGSDPDGSFHLASIYCGSGYKEGQCEPPNPESADARPKVVKVPTGVSLANSCVPGNALFSANCYPEYLANHEMIETNYNNEGRLYPNGYYWFASKFVVREIARTALTVRLVNVLIFTLLMVAVAYVCRSRVRRAVYSSILLTCLPLGSFLIASNNGSSWTIIGLSTYWAFLYTFYTTDNVNTRRFAGLLTVVAGLMAAQSRADGALFVVFSTAVVMVFASARKEVHWRDLLRHAYLAVLVVVVAVVSYSRTGQKRAVTQGLLGPQTADRDWFDVLVQNLFRIPGYFVGIYGSGNAGGGLGWLDIQLPEVVPVVMTLILGGLLFTSRGTRSKRELSLLVVTGLVIVAIPMVSFQMDRTFVGENVQSRYVLPLIIVFIGVVISGAELTPWESWGEGGRRFVVGALTVVQLVSLHRTIRRYTTGVDVLGWDLNTPREWWWATGPLPMTVLYVGTAAFAVVAAYVFFGSQKTLLTQGDMSPPS